MECKCTGMQVQVGAGRELIDTLWNVNVSTSPPFMIVFCELIDTLWNVNDNPAADDAF